MISREDTIDWNAWIALGLWLGISIGLFIREIEIYFQAMGGVAIIIGVAYFALQRRGIPQLDSDITISRLNFEKNVELGDKVQMQAVLISLLSKELLKEIRHNNRTPPENLAFLAKPLEDQVPQLAPRDWTAFFEATERTEQKRSNANQDIIRQRKIAEWTQAGLVIVGTAQTSFGNFLFAIR